MSRASPPHTLIIGGGPGGMCVGIKLQERGLPFTILERSDGFGGVWRANTYPGCGCDVPTIFYHFSFMPKKDWSLKWAKQPELLEYFEAVGSKYGLAAHSCFGMEAISAQFDTATCMWTVRARKMSDGSTEDFQAAVVVSSMGQLSRPFVPRIEGLETFQGATFHANKWDHTVDMTDKRVAVIGSGATAIQFVPHVAEQAKQVTVFQRSPCHYFCGADMENEEVSSRVKWVWSNVPGAYTMHRNATFAGMELLGKGLGTGLLKRVLHTKLDEMVQDPDLKRKLLPDYLPGCKRILIGEANNYLRALQKPHVELETTAIKRILPSGIETDTGQAPFDVIILSTGFQTQDFMSPLSVVVDEGSDLKELWRRTPQAHLGIAVAGFPNFFLTYGPNTNTGAGSILFFLECQAEYIAQMVGQMHTKGFSSVAVREDVMESFNTNLQDELKGSVFASGCGSWYVNADGLVTSNWSGSMTRYWRQTRTPDPVEYIWGKKEGQHTILASRL